VDLSTISSLMPLANDIFSMLGGGGQGGSQSSNPLSSLMGDDSIQSSSQGGGNSGQLVGDIAKAIPAILSIAAMF
jgi:hypothetical protein